MDGSLKAQQGSYGSAGIGVNHDDYDPAYIRSILASVAIIALVGASDREVRPSHGVMKFLLAKGYEVIPVNPRLAGQMLLGCKVYAALREISVAIDLVDIFRNSEAAGGIVREALALSPQPKAIWMQAGVRNDDASAQAEAAGVKIVMNRCLAIELRAQQVA
jgi:predicted CoA-binding protein